MRLPFADSAFDLIFTQLALLWINPVEQALDEIHRVMLPGGALVALEPDYGGLIEYPPEIAAREVWMNALERAGADPLTGRKLPGMLAARGFAVNVGLFDTLYAPSAARFDFLRDLPLTTTETLTLSASNTCAGAPKPVGASGPSSFLPRDSPKVWLTFSIYQI